MAMKRTSFHFDTRDMQALERLAKLETERVGTRVTAAAIIRRVVRAYLRSHTRKHQGAHHDRRHLRQKIH